MSEGAINQECYQRWLLKHPGGTVKEFNKVWNDFRAGKDFKAPEVTRLPDGTFVSSTGMSQAERATIAHEYSKAAATNQ